jgi:hypothetical protein
MLFIDRPYLIVSFNLSFLLNEGFDVLYLAKCLNFQGKIEFQSSCCVYTLTDEAILPELLVISCLR